APAWSTARISLPRLAKSAERMDGAMRISCMIFPPVNDIYCCAAGAQAPLSPNGSLPSGEPANFIARQNLNQPLEFKQQQKFIKDGCLQTRLPHQVIPGLGIDIDMLQKCSGLGLEEGGCFFICRRTHLRGKTAEFQILQNILLRLDQGGSLAQKPVG